MHKHILLRVYLKFLRIWHGQSQLKDYGMAALCSTKKHASMCDLNICLGGVQSLFLERWRLQPPPSHG